MAYTGRPPAAAPLTSGDIPDGSVAPADLSTGAPSWDASGNLLVGKTVADGAATAGSELRPDGTIRCARANTIGVFNRLSTDGNIIEFEKDGTTVGKIRSYYGRQIGIGSGDIGIMFESASYNAIRPADIDAGTASDNVIDLGTSGERFKNLYLSGGVYLGGTGAANYLDDYEEKTWSPTLYTQNSARYAFNSYTVVLAQYIKVGNLVRVVATITFNATDYGSYDNIGIQNLPFTSRSGAERADYGHLWVNDAAIDADAAVRAGTACSVGPSSTHCHLFSGGTTAAHLYSGNFSGHLRTTSAGEFRISLTYQAA